MLLFYLGLALKKQLRLAEMIGKALASLSYLMGIDPFVKACKAAFGNLCLIGTASS
ncbi:hypothetical protein D3C86_1383440 [compost metagenome]